MTYEEEIETYMSRLMSRNLAQTTIEHYGYVLKHCLEILERNGLNSSAYRIGREEITFLLVSLDVSEATKKDYLQILGKMCRNYAGRDPVADMDMMWNSPQRKRSFIETDDLRTLIDNADRTTRMVLILGAFMGMRRKEIAGMTEEDILEDCIIIHGKGHGPEGNVRRQPMPPMVKREIKDYIRWKDGLDLPDMSGGRVIVFEKYGCLYSFIGRLTTMTNRITRLGKKLDIDVSCHTLRRLFCTMLITQGCPLETVKVLMRHESLDTTLKCYVNPFKLRTEEWSYRCASSFGPLPKKEKTVKG